MDLANDSRVPVFAEKIKMLFTKGPWLPFNQHLHLFFSDETFDEVFKMYNEILKIVGGHLLTIDISETEIPAGGLDSLARLLELIANNKELFSKYDIAVEDMSKNSRVISLQNDYNKRLYPNKHDFIYVMKIKIKNDTYLLMAEETKLPNEPVEEVASIFRFGEHDARMFAPYSSTMQ